MVTKKNFLKQLIGDRTAAARLAIVLMIMVATILAGKLWEDTYVENLRDDCGSLFRDRLLPAAALFHLSDQVHTKRAAFEEFLSGQTDESQKKIDFRLGQHDARIWSSIELIEQTYLVDEESRRLSELRKHFTEYGRLESELLQRHRGGENVTYDIQMRQKFTLVHAELLGLIKVQEEVGQKLNRDSIASAAHVTTLLHIQLSITFILGLIASALAMNLVPKREKRETKEKEGETLH